MVQGLRKVHGLVGPAIERAENSLQACCSKVGARLVSVEVRPFWDRFTSALLSLSLVVAYRHTLRASLSGTFLQKDVVNQCLEFDSERRFPAPSSTLCLVEGYLIVNQYLEFAATGSVYYGFAPPPPFPPPPETFKWPMGYTAAYNYGLQPPSMVYGILPPATAIVHDYAYVSKN